MQLHDWERLRIEIGALTNCDYDDDQDHEPYLIEDQSVEHIWRGHRADISIEFDSYFV